MENNIYNENIEAEYETVTVDVDAFMRKYALFAVIAVLCVMILFAIIIRTNTSSLAVSGKPDDGNTVVNSATPTASPTLAPTPSQTPEQIETPAPQSKGIIVVDAGHGGFDPGTVGTKSGVFEKDVNLAIALKLRDSLESAGYTVIMTRETEAAIGESKEADMNRRKEIIQESGADIFISIHQNAYTENDAVRGPEVYYNTASDVAEILASRIQTEIDLVAEVENSRDVKAADHIVTRILPYSVLVECGFMTNPREEENLLSEDYQTEFAEAICRAVEKFFENDYVAG